MSAAAIILATAAFLMVTGCTAPGNTPAREAVAVVQSQPLCRLRAQFVEGLKHSYAETPIAHGLTNENDWLVELFMSKDGETWTLLLTFPNGESCLVTGGRNWRAVMPKLLKPTGMAI